MPSQRQQKSQSHIPRPIFVWHPSSDGEHLDSERPISLMTRKFRARAIMDDAAKAARQNQTVSGRSAENDKPRYSYNPVYCFFYGTLMDPDTLSRVLKLPKAHTPPIMRRATVKGYEVKLWGPYPALLPNSLQPVNGMAYKALSQLELDRLKTYETGKYSLKPCTIDLLNDDGSVTQTIAGLTFLWNGDVNELREGSFDLKEWKKEKQLRDLL